MQLDPRDQERLSAYLDGELSADEQARVEQLLADEPAARQLLDELRAVSTTLQSLPRAPVPGDLAADVLREIEARGVRRGPKPGPGGGAGSAASDKSRALEATIAEATDNTITDSKDDPSDAQRSADSRKAAVSTAATPLSKSIAARDDRDGRHNQPLTWRQRIVRPLVYAGIAVAVFAAVSLMTEPVADDPVHVARQLEEDVQPDEAGGAAETWDMAERGRDGAIAAKDGGRRRSQVRSEGQTAGPAATAGPSDNVVDQSAPAAANGMVLSKPGAMPAQAGAEVHGVGGAAAPVHAPDPRMFYIQQALVNQEPVLVVQCRVTPEAARKDLVGKLLAKNHVAIDDEAAAELDTAINSNIFPSLATQQAVPGAALAPQLAMPAQARPGVAAPSPPSVAAGEEPLPRRQDTDRKVAKQAPADGDADSPGNEPAELADTPAEPSPDATVYLVDASPEQLEAVLSELNSQTDEVLSVAVSPAPETPAQSDYLSYNRAGPRDPAAESSPDAVGQQAAPVADQIAETSAADAAPADALQRDRTPPRIAKADEVRLQVQALGVLEQQLQESPSRNEKLDRFSNLSRARKLRPDTLSNLAPPPGPDGTSYYNNPEALFAQSGANSANSAPAPLEPNAAPAEQTDEAEDSESRMANARKAGGQPGKGLQRAVIVLEIAPAPAERKKG